MGIAARTKLSSKGQMVLPSRIRQECNWGEGTELTVETVPEGVLVKAVESVSPFPPTRFEDVLGSLKYDGPPISIEDMDRAITEAVAERHARGRY